MGNNIELVYTPLTDIEKGTIGLIDLVLNEAERTNYKGFEIIKEVSDHAMRYIKESQIAGEYFDNSTLLAAVTVSQEQYAEEGTLLTEEDRQMVYRLTQRQFNQLNFRQN